jgi:crotonobetainyl-CoA:carnitine CoA-transferase CaiB-like acyl-CoA transferase
MPGLPFRYSGVDSWIHKAAPMLGEHNSEVLQEIFGLSELEIAQLVKDEVIGDRPKGL